MTLDRYFATDHSGRPGWMAMRTSLKALSIQKGIDPDGNVKSETLALRHFEWVNMLHSEHEYS